MLHAPTSETKSETTRSNPSVTLQPERELSPRQQNWMESHFKAGAGISSLASKRRTQFANLQHSYGNQAVLRMLRNSNSETFSGVGNMVQRKCAKCEQEDETLQRRVQNSGSTLIQPKLTVNQPGDKYEQEADRVADQVMRMPEPSLQRQVEPEEEKEEEPIQSKPLAGEITPLIQRQTEEEEEEPMQAQSMEGQPVQRQEEKPEEEEEEPVQTKLMDNQIQRQEEEPEEEEEEPVQMKGQGGNTRAVSPQLEAGIQSMKGGGRSLEPATRAFFEPRFVYDFSRVRVHTGASAARAAQGINAQAFTRGRDIFFGAGRYQPNTEGGRRLLAHELTHTIQQVPWAARKVIQRRISAVTSTTPTSSVPTESLSGGNGPAIQKQETPEDEGEGDRVQAKSITDNADADWGADREIESDLHQSKGGSMTLPAPTQASMGRRFGADFSQVRIHTDPTAAALSQQLGAQAFTYGSDIYFNTGYYNFNSSAGQRLLAHELTHTIQQGAITATTLSPALPSNTSAIQRSPGISSWLEKAAKYIPGYTLIKFILGRSPITGKRVEPTGLNFLEAVLGLIPGFGPIWFEQLQKAKVAEKAGAWLDQEIKKVDITWDGIKALLAELRRRAYYVRFWKNIPLIKEIFAPTWVKIKVFLGKVGSKVKQLIVAGVMRMAGPVGKKLLAAIQKGGKVLKAIFRNPIVFLANLFEAARKGFQQFGKKIRKHLKAGLIGWLFGAVKGLKIQAPATFDLKGIVTFIMEATGLTYDQRVRPPLKKRLGEKRLSYLEKAVHFFIILKEKGLSGIWKQIKGLVGSLKKMLFEGVRNLLITKVVTAAIGKLVTMLNPAGLLAQGIAAIYNIVMFVIERFQQIADVVGAIFKSVAHIAAGKLVEAANYVEKTLARTLPVVISLLARLTIDGVAQHIMRVIGSLKARVKKITIRLVNFIVTKARKFFKEKVVKSEADVSPRERRLHQKYIQDMKDILIKPMTKKTKTFEEFYSYKKQEALHLVKVYQKKVRKGIKIEAKFLNLIKDKKDRDVDIKIRIAPNSNELSFDAPVYLNENGLTKLCYEKRCNIKKENQPRCVENGNTILTTYFKAFKDIKMDFPRVEDIHLGWMCYEWTSKLLDKFKDMNLNPWQLQWVGRIDKYTTPRSPEEIARPAGVVHNYVYVALHPPQSRPKHKAEACGRILDPWKEDQPKVFEPGEQPYPWHNWNYIRGSKDEGCYFYNNQWHDFKLKGRQPLSEERRKLMLKVCKKAFPGSKEADENGRKSVYLILGIIAGAEIQRLKDKIKTVNSKEAVVYQQVLHAVEKWRGSQTLATIEIVSLSIKFYGFVNELNEHDNWKEYLKKLGKYF